MNFAKLKSNWNGLLSVFNIDRHQSELIFSNLVEAYQEPTRKYHNLNHIQQVLDTVEEVKNLAGNFSLIILSVWFHDYIYDPKKQDNELQSALAAEKILRSLNVPDEIIKQTKTMIISTSKHQPLLNSPLLNSPLLNSIDNLLFLDADLSILGTSPDKYLQYAQAIRQEYSWVGDRHYPAARIKVLIDFLSRDAIYYTDYFQAKLESQARINLQTEIQTLQDSSVANEGDKINNEVLRNNER